MRVQARPIHSVDECREGRCGQSHHAIADRWLLERPMLEPLPAHALALGHTVVTDNKRKF
jgi:hypothetical protein